METLKLDTNIGSARRSAKEQEKMFQELNRLLHYFF